MCYCRQYCSLTLTKQNTSCTESFWLHLYRQTYNFFTTQSYVVLIEDLSGHFSKLTSRFKIANSNEAFDMTIKKKINKRHYQYEKK